MVWAADLVDRVGALDVVGRQRDEARPLDHDCIRGVRTVVTSLIKDGSVSAVSAGEDRLVLPQVVDQGYEEPGRAHLGASAQERP